MKTIAIIQARMRSTRLPNKSMLYLHGHPVIEWVYTRTSKSTLIDGLIVAVPNTEEDDVLEIYLKQIGGKVFRGNEVDVLDRVYRAGKALQATHVVRICGDNPFVSGEEIDNLIRFYRTNVCDYAYNHISRDNLYPEGLGAEIVSFELIEYIQKEAKLKSQREHILNFIWDFPNRFSIKTFDPRDKELAHPDIKISLDTYADYKEMLSYSTHINVTPLELIRSIKEKSF